MFIVPVVGTIFFFIIGTPKLSRRRRAIQDDVTRSLRQQTDYLERSKLTTPIAGNFSSVAQLATSLTSLAPTRNNQADIIYGYDSIIQDMVEAIDSAKHHVLVQFYVLALDETTEPFFQALERAAERGVAIYVLFDAWGSHKYLRRKEMKQRLTAMGADWRSMLPFSLHPHKYNRPDLRNHRKIVVVDTEQAYIGSLNMIDKGYHRKDGLSYIELAIRLRGPSVTQTASVFTSDWYAETSELPRGYTLEEASTTPEGSSSIQVVPSGSSYQYRNNLKVFVALVHRAERSIVINNPYLVPDESLFNALVSAAQRGVRVSVLNSESMDQWMVGHAQRSYYQELMEAGVSISLYNKPQLVHEKFISIDDEVGVVGSSNLDIRSFELNLECIVLAYDEAIAKTLHARHQELLQNSQTLTLEAWRERRLTSQILESVTRLTSSLQ